MNHRTKCSGCSLSVEGIDKRQAGRLPAQVVDFIAEQLPELGQAVETAVCEYQQDRSVEKGDKAMYLVDYLKCALLTVRDHPEG